MVTEIDPKINYPRLNELAHELTNFLIHLEAFYLDASAGFSLVRARVLEDQEAVRKLIRGTECDSEEFQDGRMFSYDLVFKADFCGSDLHRVRQGDVKARNTSGGSNYVMLGRLCIVALSDYWNEYLRREYVIAKGQLDPNESRQEIVQEKLRKNASLDLWGDVGRIRNAIVHHQGLADFKVANCKLLRWFKEEDTIDITPPRFRALLLLVYMFRNKIHDEQFPKSYIKVDFERYGMATKMKDEDGA